jgi:hypothetical protein
MKTIRLLLVITVSLVFVAFYASSCSDRKDPLADPRE